MYPTDPWRGPFALALSVGGTGRRARWRVRDQDREMRCERAKTTAVRRAEWIPWPWVGTKGRIDRHSGASGLSIPTIGVPGRVVRIGLGVVELRGSACESVRGWAGLGTARRWLVFALVIRFWLGEKVPHGSDA